MSESSNEMLKIKFDEIMLENHVRAPTDVYAFVEAMNTILNSAFEKDEEPEKISYMKKLYYACVFEAQKFKLRLLKADGQSSSFAEDDEAEALDDTPDKAFPPATAIQLKGGTIFAYIVRGTANTPVSSELKEITVNGNKVIVPVVSFKLFQALISILVTSLGFQAGLPPAKLGANAVRACTTAEAAKDQMNWFVHAHSGLNFVANFVKNFQDKAKAKGVMDSKQIKMVQAQFPMLEDLLMLAYRMDQQMVDKLTEKRDKDRLKDFRYPMLRSVIQSTGLTEAEWLKFAHSKNVKNWGKYVTSQALALAFASAIKKLEEGVSSSQEKTSKATEY